MNKHLKVLIGFDGSVYSEAAINDLRLAGMPRDGEALIVSVQDSIPSSVLSNNEFVERTIGFTRILPTAALLQEQALIALESLQDSVDEAAKNASFYLPEWKIGNKVSTGIPAAVLLDEAELSEADLIIVGSHGRTAFGRFFLGSVSTEVAEKALCSVRIVREKARENLQIVPRIVAAVDHSPEAEKVIRQIGNRVWNNETEVRLVSIDDGVSPHRISVHSPHKESMLEWATEQLEAIGLKVSVEFIKGDLKTVLLEEARRWNANSIFIAASKSKQNIDEAVKGIIAKAHCTVEIIR